MAPKKKPAAKEGEEDLLGNFRKDYSKLMKQFEGVKKMEDVERTLGDIDNSVEGFVDFWYFTEEFDPMGFRLTMQALASSHYNQFKALRLWKTGGGDEAVRAICFYLDSHCQKTEGVGVKELQLVDCDVGTLGCSFLGRSLGFGGNFNVQCLVLDFNQIGSEGMEQLAQGLAQNRSLMRLDLNYCGIDSKGGRFLFEILIFVYSNLEQLGLRGNDLEKEGLLEVVRGAKRAKKMKAVDLADNKFGEDKETIEALISLLQTNLSIEKYDLVGNYITDVGAEKLIHGLIGLHHLKEVKIPEQCSMGAHEALETALGGAKGGKKGKKGKKKK
jgi:hypothetical protein